MPRWLRAIVVLIISIVCIVVIRNIEKAKRREEHYAEYQAALTKFTQALKPGTTRKQVEDYLRAQNLMFHRTCCSNDRHVFATEVRVGQEDRPWYCSEWNVYVRFEFNTTEPDRYPIREPSDGDTLSDLHLRSRGEGCL
jgi:hypothetical protein